ncbi:MAG: Yip1 family protein [Caldimonas sp.]
MALIERVQSILLKPRQTWPVIAAEGGDAASIYTGYVMILAAIPAVAAFIGLTMVGVGGFGVSYRLPILSGLVQMIVSYLLTLAMVFVLALIVNALAPTFGGTKDPVRALKLVAYGMTASFVGGIFSLIPALALLGVLASLYSIFLIYTGIAVMMRCPADKAVAYTAVVIVCGIVVGICIAAVVALVTPGMGAGAQGGVTTGAAGPGGNVTIKAPDGSNVTINPGAMTELAKRMEEAGKRMESAQKSGDSAAAGKAMGEMMGAITGGSATPIASADLKTMLPESVGDMKRTGIEASSGQAMGIAGSSAKATYANGERRLTLSITDTGGLAGLAAMAGWANMTMDKETEVKVEKVYKDGVRTVHEEYRKDGSHGEVTTILANGVIVEADGKRVDVDSLKKVLAGLDLARLEAMKRPAK